jgi:hypothetical protein
MAPRKKTATSAVKPGQKAARTQECNDVTQGESSPVKMLYSNISFSCFYYLLLQRCRAQPIPVLMAGGKLIRRQMRLFAPPASGKLFPGKQTKFVQLQQICENATNIMQLCQFEQICSISHKFVQLVTNLRNKHANYNKFVANLYNLNKFAQLVTKLLC